MSLNKAIAFGKEHRKPYTGGKKVDKRCENHGGCDYCIGNRMHNFNKALDAALSKKEEENERA